MTVGCIVAYNVIGSEVLSDGTLVEPFYLIPIAWLSLFIGAIGLIIRSVSYFKFKKLNI
ncbi:MAG: DUF3955 domain-containing protein [Terrisporobacter sp.]